MFDFGPGATCLSDGGDLILGVNVGGQPAEFGQSNGEDRHVRMS